MPPLSAPLTAIRHPAFLYDADGTIAEANDLAEALAGRPLTGRTLAAVVGVFDARSPNGTPLMVPDLPASRALAGEEAVDVPLVITAADGRTLHVLATAAPILNGGEVVGVLSIWQDMPIREGMRAGAETAAAALQVQQEELLQQGDELDREQQLLDGILGAMPHHVSLWDRDQRLVWANEHFAAALGEPREALAGRTWRELWGEAPELAPLVEGALRSVGAGVPLDLELEAAGPAGPGWRAVTFLPIFGDQVLVITEEITERKRAEAARREAEGHLARAQEIAHVGSWAWDIPGDLLIWSDETYRILALQPGEIATPRFEDFLAFVHPDDRERLTTGVQDALVKGDSDVEFRFLRKGGGEGYAHSQAAVTFKDGAPVRMEGTVHDITGRKRAEEGEARLQALMDHNPCLVFLKDTSGRYVYLNETYERQFSLSKDWYGKTDYDFWPRESAELFRANDREVLESGRTRQFLEDSTGLDGKRYVWLNYKFPFTDAQGERFIGGIGIDTTAKQQAEEALRETRDYLDNLINHANAPIIVWDPEFRITRFNAAFEHLSGYAADEVIGRDLVILFPEESREESLGKIHRTITEQWQSVEIPILRPDGGVRIALWNSANIYDREGTTLLATIAQGQDITERKEAEGALRSYAENLRRSNEDLERFAYVSSHDLQEPLRAIVSFSQLLERRYKGQLGQDADDYIDFIVEGGMRMQSLIQDLLAYSRVNTTKQDLRPTDMEDVMAAVERSLTLQLREAGTVLTHDPVPTVLADPLQLEQVLMNLVSNAIKFRRQDEPLRIHVCAQRLNGFWQFAVSDNGIGIEAEYLDRIFVIFQRLHTKDAYPGTGIGLAIVKRIIDRHRGTVRVESTPGEGSTFFFTLPAADSAARHGSR
jgi:PAS domain S-box-containing protein